MLYQGAAKHTITTLSIHCSATRPEWWAKKPVEAVTAEIRRWHVQDRKWRDIGYHQVIHRDGKRAPGRPLNQIGAHILGHNPGKIAVCLIGGHGSASTDSFEDHYTPEQHASLIEYIQEVEQLCGRELILEGHNQYANKACPGFNVPLWQQKVYPVSIMRKQPTLVAPVKAAEPAPSFWEWLRSMFRG